MRVLAGAAACALVASGTAATRAEDLDPVATGDDTPSYVRTLAALRPDYTLYVAAVRPLAPGVTRRLYMALVRPGATDPAGRGSAPFAGRGARNDIVYDGTSVTEGHSAAWRSLLLDHEYLHARHMAGATLLPVARGERPEVERHYNESAAWAFNVEEARAGRYPGLRSDEFREALDRLGEHYAALRTLLQDSDPDRWRTMSDLLRRPERFLETTGTASLPVSAGGGGRLAATAPLAGRPHLP